MPNPKRRHSKRRTSARRTHDSLTRSVLSTARGIVLARRLSNAEYDYTIRDLTGVDIRPTREFPVDPANEAGFDNSAESLAMSPALVKKYLEAARSEEKSRAAMQARMEASAKLCLEEIRKGLSK